MQTTKKIEFFSCRAEFNEWNNISALQFMNTEGRKLDVASETILDVPDGMCRFFIVDYLASKDMYSRSWTILVFLVFLRNLYFCQSCVLTVLSNSTMAQVHAFKFWELYKPSSQMDPLVSTALLCLWGWYVACFVNILCLQFLQTHSLMWDVWFNFQCEQVLRLRSVG